MRPRLPTTVARRGGVADKPSGSRARSNQDVLRLRRGEAARGTPDGALPAGLRLGAGADCATGVVSRIGLRGGTGLRPVVVSCGRGRHSTNSLPIC